MDQTSSRDTRRGFHIQRNRAAGPLVTARRLIARGLDVLLLALVMSAALVTGFAALILVIRNGLTSDAAGWAQASGSTLAIGAAIWLTGAEARTTRRWRRQQGEESAWGVRFVIAQAQLDSHIVAAELFELGRPLTATDVKPWRQRADNASLALTSLLNRSDYLHPAVILFITNSKVLVEHLQKDLSILSDTVISGEKPEQALIDDVLRTHLTLAEVLKEFDARWRGVRHALDRGDDMLPVAEWLAPPAPRDLPGNDV